MTQINDNIAKSSPEGKMRRWILKAGINTIESLRMEHVTIPEPQAGQVRVKVIAASINYRDQIVLNGSFGPISQDIIPLSDGAGIIDAIGFGVTQWKEGDKVTTAYATEEWSDGPPIPGLTFGLGADSTDGVLAEYIVLSAKRLIAAPDSLTLIEASTIPCAALTAWTALNGDRPYKKQITNGDKVLALGTGGVSLFALLLAKAAGAEIFGTSSTEVKLNLLRRLGVSYSINYIDNARWGESLFEQTGGVNKVVNSIGGSAVEQSIAAVGYGGEVAFMGLFDFTEKAPNYVSLMMKGASIRGTAVGSHAAHQDLIAFIDKHNIKPPIDKVFKFEEVKEAYQAATSRELFGKIVIRID